MEILLNVNEIKRNSAKISAIHNSLVKNPNKPKKQLLICIGIVILIIIITVLLILLEFIIFTNIMFTIC